MKIASLVTSSTFSVYLLVNRRSALTARSGVFCRPSRLRSSPTASRTILIAEEIALWDFSVASVAVVLRVEDDGACIMSERYNGLGKRTYITYGGQGRYPWL